MATRTRSGDVAALEAGRLVSRLVAEIRDARMTAGLSLHTAARAAGMSPSQLGRLERDELDGPTFEQVWRAASVVGLRGGAGLHPSGSPVRDRGHLALLERLESRLRSPLRLRREVPLPIQGDRRTWDGMVEGDGSPFFVEGESHIRDVQAMERRLRLKLRDEPRGSVLIVVATRSTHHRLVLRDHRETMRDLLPLDGAAILRALSAGTRPAASGIVLL